MACVSDRTRATLRVAAIGIVAVLGACADGPNLPSEADPPLLVPGPAPYVYPIEGVTGTACRAGYIDDGGGGCIYAPVPEDDWGSSGGGATTTGGTSGASGGAAGGGTTSTSGWDESAYACDPKIHPDCEKPLTGADSAAIGQALADHLRPAAQFTDSLARKDCEQMARWFRDAMQAGAVVRGAFDSNFTNDVNRHYGSYSRQTGKIHFDPWLLSAAAEGDAYALRQLAITALHEAAHKAGNQHPSGFTSDGRGNDYYVDPPFHRLNPGENSCVPR